jgi:hypothetical protein
MRREQAVGSGLGGRDPRRKVVCVSGSAAGVIEVCNGVLLERHNKTLFIIITTGRLP